jgi:hypothetical protein
MCLTYVCVNESCAAVRVLLLCPIAAAGAAVQDMCIVLELRDPTLLVPSLKKVAAVAAAIPSVETFVAQVGGGAPGWGCLAAPERWPGGDLTYHRSGSSLLRFL